MNMKLPTLAATVALFSASCKDNSKPVQHNLDVQPPNPAPAALTPPPTPGGQLDPRVTAALKAVPRTLLEIDAISRLQEESFAKTGEWLKPGQERDYEARLLDAASRDLRNTPYHDSPGAADELMEEINRAGYHLYLSGTALQDKPYLTVVMYALGEPKHSEEFAQVKKFLKFDRESASMRELIKLFATPFGDELYGSVSKTGDVLVSPQGIARDLFVNERDPRVVFLAVLANEVGHLKLAEARKQGALKTNEHSLDEAFSDYCTFLVTPEKETVFALFDVMATTSPRYEESKECARTGLENFGRRHIPGFRGLAEESSKTILLDRITHRATIDICTKLKKEILGAYRQTLMAKGFPGELF